MNAPRTTALLALPSPDGNRVIANRAYQAQSFGLIPIQKSQKRKLQRRSRIELMVISQALFLHEVIGISAEPVDVFFRLFKEGAHDEINQIGRQMPNKSQAVDRKSTRLNSSH